MSIAFREGLFVLPRRVNPISSLASAAYIHSFSKVLEREACVSCGQRGDPAESPETISYQSLLLLPIHSTQQLTFSSAISLLLNISDLLLPLDSPRLKALLHTPHSTVLYSTHSATQPSSLYTGISWRRAMIEIRFLFSPRDASVQPRVVCLARGGSRAPEYARVSELSQRRLGDRVAATLYQHTAPLTSPPYTKYIYLRVTTGMQSK